MGLAFDIDKLLVALEIEEGPSGQVRKLRLGYRYLGAITEEVLEILAMRISSDVKKKLSEALFPKVAEPTATELFGSRVINPERRFATQDIQDQLGWKLNEEEI